MADKLTQAERRQWASNLRAMMDTPEYHEGIAMLEHEDPQYRIEWSYGETEHYFSAYAAARAFHDNIHSLSSYMRDDHAVLRRAVDWLESELENGGRVGVHGVTVSANDDRSGNVTVGPDALEESV